MDVVVRPPGTARSEKEREPSARPSPPAAGGIGSLLDTWRRRRRRIHSAGHRRGGRREQSRRLETGAALLAQPRRDGARRVRRGRKPRNRPSGSGAHRAAPACTWRAARDRRGRRLDGSRPGAPRLGRNRRAADPPAGPCERHDCSTSSPRRRSPRSRRQASSDRPGRAAGLRPRSEGETAVARALDRVQAATTVANVAATALGPGGCLEGRFALACPAAGRDGALRPRLARERGARRTGPSPRSRSLVRVKPMLGDWEIPHIESIGSLERRAARRARHPGRAASLYQDLNAAPTHVVISGQPLRRRGSRRVPRRGPWGVQSRRADHLRRRRPHRDGGAVRRHRHLRFEQTATRPEEIAYLISVRESPPPPPPPDPLGGLDTSLLDEAGGFLDTVTGALDAHRDARQHPRFRRSDEAAFGCSGRRDEGGRRPRRRRRRTRHALRERKETDADVSSSSWSRPYRRTR